MSKVSQNAVLENYLRGTGRTLTEAQAAARFGIMNLSARMSEFRNEGLTVRVGRTTTTGKATYAVSRDNMFGSKARVFS